MSASFTTPDTAFVASGDGKLWMGGSKIWTLDPQTGKRSLVFQIRPSAINGLKGPLIGPGPLLVILHGRVYVDLGAVTVLRIDPSTHTMTESQPFIPFRFEDDSRMTVGQNSLWLTSTQTNELLRVDPNTLDVQLRVKVGTGPIGVAYGAGSIWVANSAAGTVMRIDPVTGRILATIHVGGTPYEMAFAHRLAWVTLL